MLMDTETRKAYDWALNQHATGIEARYARLLAEALECLIVPRPLDEHHEDMGPALFWTMPENKNDGLVYPIFNDPLSSDFDRIDPTPTHFTEVCIVDMDEWIPAPNGAENAQEVSE